jgi:hypothetical protein
MKEALVRIEIERILNLVAGFGWTKVEEKTAPGEITLTLKKTLPIEEV